MIPKKNNPKYRISVVLDLSKNSDQVFINAVEMAKTINASIEVLHVKPAIDVVKRESQFSAIDTIYKDDRETRAKMHSLIQHVPVGEELPIAYTLVYGNVKNTVKEHLEQHKPDIVVLGKRRNRLGLWADSLTDFVVSEAKTNVLIMGEDHKFHTFRDLNLGFFGNEMQLKGLEIIKDLKRDNDKPVRLFQIKNQDASEPQQENLWKKTVSYVFTEGSNAMDGLVSYVARTNTQLLCVHNKAQARHLVRKSNVPIFVMA
ncbi:MULTISPECIES: universal stress protein [Flavobacteriaceae]|uniref:universal stress protein n=1 Tax=Flavobacteriaceae TaxID=49546 RepID=UPI0023497E23|nr:universal stress protein [Muricauda sp. SP22]MDC6363334.1 universal stress protein [Muricauda sp. SP22]